MLSEIDRLTEPGAIGALLGLPTAEDTPPPTRRESSAQPPRVRPRGAPALALSSPERGGIVVLFNSGRFADATPYTAFVRLFDEGTYLASVRTVSHS